MNILDKIIAHKKKEVEERKARIPMAELEKSPYFNLPVISLSKCLKEDDASGIIAEFKRKSPSKGIINQDADITRTVQGYENSGASAVSILTDQEFFGGSIDDLIKARRSARIPILRKEFIVNEYQIVEARSVGADAILLLANIFTPREIKDLSTTAKFLGLEILLEVRDKAELDAVNILVDCIGINNRNLKDFSVDVSRSFELAALIPKGHLKISESGIGSAKTIYDLKQAGFNGFLIGETFMKEKDPAEACAKFIKEINSYKPGK